MSLEQAVRTQADIAMMGDGFYSRVSKGPKAVVDNCRDLIAGAIAQIDPQPGAFSIADFGAADGGTSADLWSDAVRRIRSRSPNQYVSVTYTDLPGADFGTLFRNLDATAGYPARFGDVSVFASGRSFYRQILPTDSLHLGFSSSAMHYLSVMPGVLREHVHSVGGSGKEQATFAAQSRLDWATILEHRARELATGGRLVLAVFCIGEDGSYLGNTTSQNMFDNYARLWWQMAQDNLLTPEEVVATAFQQHYKTIEENLAPLNDSASAAYQAGLRLETAEVRVVRCPFRSAFEVGEIDLAQFAREFVNTHRSWTETTFRAGLDTQRSPESVEEILNELYRRYEDLVMSNPHGHAKDLVHLYLVAQKVG